MMLVECHGFVNNSSSLISNLFLKTYRQTRLVIHLVYCVFIVIGALSELLFNSNKKKFTKKHHDKNNQKKCMNVWFMLFKI